LPLHFHLIPPLHLPASTSQLLAIQILKILKFSRPQNAEKVEIVQQDIIDPSIEVGSGCQWTGSGREPQWNNPKSIKAYDHIERHHGPKLKPENFRGRIASKNTNQGQWLNAQDWVEAEKFIPKYHGKYIVNFKRPIGRVYRTDGTITENVTRAFIIRNEEGRLKTAYPILNTDDLSSLTRSNSNE